MNVDSGYAEVNGTKLYYEIAGQGEPIVLIHGNFGDVRYWDDQFLDFATHYKVVRFDVRGYGKSDAPVEGQPYNDYEDLRALLDYLDIKQTHIAGFSMGSGIAINFVLVYQKFLWKHLILHFLFSKKHQSNQFLQFPPQFQKYSDNPLLLFYMQGQLANHQ